MGTSLEPDINPRHLHPHLYWMIMVSGFAFLGVGMNFFFLSPTFTVFQTPYVVWASIFTAIGAAKMLLLHFSRRLVRVVMMVSLAFTLMFAAGTSEPFIHGEGSMQLPILYVAFGMLELFMLVEPFSNPETAKDP